MIIEFWSAQHEEYEVLIWKNCNFVPRVGDYVEVKLPGELNPHKREVISVNWVTQDFIIIWLN